MSRTVDEWNENFVKLLEKLEQQSLTLDVSKFSGNTVLNKYFLDIEKFPVGRVVVKYLREETVENSLGGSSE